MDDLFFVISKLFWAIASPDHLLLLVFTAAVFLSRPDRSRQMASSRPRGRRLLWSVLLLSWLIALVPLGNFLLYPLESRFSRPALPPQEEVAGVIVLGGAERIRASNYWDSYEVNEVGERPMTMLMMLQRYPEVPVIFTGGSGSVFSNELRSADIVKRFLTTMGLQDRVIYERESRNTYENALFTRDLIDQQRQGHWLLVTSAFHMPRSVGLFRQQGVDVTAYPVDYWSLPPERDINFNLAGNLTGLKMAMREWIGLFAYWLTGKIPILLPAQADTSPISQKQAARHADD